MTNKNLLLTLFGLLLAFAPIAAQTHTIQGHVVNQSNGELLEMTTIRLFSYSADGTDSTLVQGVQTDMKGAFFLNAKDGHYQLIVSNVGFFPKKVPVHVAGKDVILKSIGLKEDVQALGEVQVRGTAAELTVRGDTLEYNAAAYKVNENAMVEDLLKKMSGVVIDADGKVTINGEEVKSVRIDGKKFFGDDVQMATKNIPADMIEKVQVVDEKSDMAKLTGIEDDETERIINLKLKENKKKGMFGNFSGALGADALGDDQKKLFHYNYQGTPAEKTAQFFNEDFRYNANAFMNLMLGESQTTIIAGANNTNEFRSGRGRGFRMGNNSGITWGENLGVNSNVVMSPTWTFGGDASLNHNRNYTLTDSEKEQYSDGITYNNSDSTNKTGKSWDASMRLEFEWKPDSLNTLLIKPNMTYTNSWTDQVNDFTYLMRDTVNQTTYDTLSWGNQRNEGISKEISANVQLIYNHKFASKRGRSISLDARGGFTDTDGDSYNMASGSIEPVDQHQDKLSNSYNYSLKFTYIEPIFNLNNYIETNLYFGQTFRTSDKRQYNYDPVKGDYSTQLDTTYSNTFLNNYFNEYLEVNYRYLKDKYDLTVGVRANPSQTRSTTTYADGYVFDTLNSVWNFAPRMTFKYKFGKKEFARIIYRGFSQQPSVSQMEPVRDNSNAMSETVGNLGLNPAFRNIVRMMYSRYNQDRLSSLTTGIRANFTKDALVYNTIYDNTGKAYRQTVNAKATPFDIGGDLMYNTPVIKNRLHFFTRTEVGYNQRIAYVSHTNDAVDSYNLQLGEESKTGNWRASENLSLRLSHDVIDFGIRGNIAYSRTNNNQTENITNTIDWGVTADFTFHLPYNWSISTDIGYNDKWGYNLSGSLSEIMWNATVEKTWKNATLSLNMKDILNQKKNVVETIGENYIQYQRFNTLPTYFTLSFTYKLNKMGDLKATGRGAFMQEMIENGGKFKPGKGPMGPPPGM